MQRAIRTLLIRECIEASELLILFSIHPPWRVREQIRFPTHTYSFRIIEIFWNCYSSLKVEVWNKNSISIFFLMRACACLPFHTTNVTFVLFFRKTFSPTCREDVGIYSQSNCSWRSTNQLNKDSINWPVI